jgi:signal transduction histidine kinase
VQEYQEALRDIGAETERVTSLIGDLLTLARADAGLGVAEQKPLELGAIAAEAVRHMDMLAETRGIRLRFEPATRPVMVCGDRSAMQRVFCILLDNAIKYTPPGGDVAVHVNMEWANVVAEVRDQGVGIGPEDVPRIFERFYRADRARTRDSGGAGLGLSIARWIVQTHGGEIRVTSKPGEGSIFRVELPQAESRNGIGFGEFSE